MHVSTASIHVWLQDHALHASAIVQVKARNQLVCAQQVVRIDVILHIDVLEVVGRPVFCN